MQSKFHSDCYSDAAPMLKCKRSVSTSAFEHLSVPRFQVGECRLLATCWHSLHRRKGAGADLPKYIDYVV